MTMDINITINNYNKENWNSTGITEDEDISVSASMEDEREEDADFEYQLAYICAPYYPKTDTPERREMLLHQTRKACDFMTIFGQVPICPALYFLQFLNGANRYERALEYGLASLSHCTSVVVVGEYLSDEMKAEISKAHELGIPVSRLSNPVEAWDSFFEQLREEINSGKDTDE